MSDYRQKLGKFGEDAAVGYLKSKGYRIAERNFRVRGGELDIVAETDSLLIFVEVKTRSSSRYGAPAEAVNRKKQEHMRFGAEGWLAAHPTEKELRFDVIEVAAVWNGGAPQLEDLRHISGIVMEG